MVGWGLIGAAQGIGKGLEEVGKGMEERRAKALEYAKKEAIEEARLQQQAMLAQNKQAFDIEQTNFREGQANRRAAEGIASREAIATQQIAGRATLQDKIITGQKDLARLRGQIAKDTTMAGIRLRDQLGDANVHAVGYDHVDKNGYGEVILIRRDGSLGRTGEKIKVPEGSDGLILSGGGAAPKINYGAGAPVISVDDDDEEE